MKKHIQYLFSLTLMIYGAFLVFDSLQPISNIATPQQTLHKTNKINPGPFLVTNNGLDVNNCHVCHDTMVAGVPINIQLVPVNKTPVGVTITLDELILDLSSDVDGGYLDTMPISKSIKGCDLKIPI